MMYFLGAVMIDAKPFSADAVRRDSSGSLVVKPVMGGRQRKENVGEGEDDLTLSGSLLPNRIGGLTQLEVLHSMRRNGARFPVMRGDGTRLGWYGIKAMTEEHRDLMSDGVGFELLYTIVLEQADERPGDGQSVIGGLLSLFSLNGVL
ncbi:phage tail protein [Agrobacterium tumefaciens]|uniref:phage tail protein n=1 Tax=Agrobacterium tumefaciens TaxID=358 RepID=UPI0021D3175E|nr:phage tail protein [Agrobacterium tumefaciens]UXS04480.1 phage tail protein [Agrobacterium tumefaciens]